LRHIVRRHLPAGLCLRAPARIVAPRDVVLGLRQRAVNHERAAQHEDERHNVELALTHFTRLQRARRHVMRQQLSAHPSCLLRRGEPRGHGVPKHCAREEVGAARERALGGEAVRDARGGGGVGALRDGQRAVGEDAQDDERGGVVLEAREGAQGGGQRACLRFGVCVFGHGRAEELGEELARGGAGVQREGGGGARGEVCLRFQVGEAAEERFIFFGLARRRGWRLAVGVGRDAGGGSEVSSGGVEDGGEPARRCADGHGGRRQGCK
ncbi:hypothetical protein DFH09DRAFT_1493372, partial [Mycena vulgaris]